MMQRVTLAWRLRPDASGLIASVLFHYLQVRQVYQAEGFWEPELAALDSPWDDGLNCAR